MEFKNVLITGIGGSAGSYLAEYIVENHPEVKVSGIVRWHTEPSLKNLQDCIDDGCEDPNDPCETFYAMPQAQQDGCCEKCQGNLSPLDPC